MFGRTEKVSHKICDRYVVAKEGMRLKDNKMNWDNGVMNGTWNYWTVTASQSILLSCRSLDSTAFCLPHTLPIPSRMTDIARYNRRSRLPNLFQFQEALQRYQDYPVYGVLNI